jgi:glycosyltransferase involved in cell wall biosynthesis
MTARAPALVNVRADSETFLCVCNFPSNTGFAWDFIERLYAGVSDHLATKGIRTVVAYPKIGDSPRSLRNSTAEPIELNAAPVLNTSLKSLLRFIRRERVRGIYFTDQAPASFIYPLLRAYGVRFIIVHDHTSGDRKPARGMKRAVKWFLTRLPGVAADRVLAVSDYVARRQTEVALIPRRRVTRVWNGVDIPPLPSGENRLREIVDVDPARPIVAVCCRAHPVKGVQHVLRAFDMLWALHDPAKRPVLAYVGNGPALDELEKLRASLSSANDIRFLGYREDAFQLLGGADVCVSASIWQEAFGLGVLEPMSLGKAVVATAVGGVPEILTDGVSGILVPPADEQRLADAIDRLLNDSALRARLGAAARERAAAHFTIQSQIASLSAIVAKGLGE